MKNARFSGSANHTPKLIPAVKVRIFASDCGSSTAFYLILPGSVQFIDNLTNNLTPPPPPPKREHARAEDPDAVPEAAPALRALVDVMQAECLQSGCNVAPVGEDALATVAIEGQPSSPPCTRRRQYIL